MVNLKFSILITVNAKNCDISLEVFGEDLQEGKSRAFTFYIPATGMHLVTLSPRSFNTVLLNSLEKYLWRVKNMFTTMRLLQWTLLTCPESHKQVTMVLPGPNVLATYKFGKRGVPSLWESPDRIAKISLLEIKWMTISFLMTHRIYNMHSYAYLQ